MNIYEISQHRVQCLFRAPDWSIIYVFVHVLVTGRRGKKKEVKPHDPHKGSLFSFDRHSNQMRPLASERRPRRTPQQSDFSCPSMSLSRSPSNCSQKQCGIARSRRAPRSSVDTYRHRKLVLRSRRPTRPSTGFWEGYDPSATWHTLLYLRL